MIYPLSLPDEVKARAFRASNGELAFLFRDAPAVLAACRADAVEVLGWELWIADHDWGADHAPKPAPGMWSGGIPVVGKTLPVVFGGEGDLAETERQLSELNLAEEVQPRWLPYVRVNFTFG